MILSIHVLLLLTAFIVVILHAIGKAPLWIADLLIIVALLIGAAGR